MGNCLETHNGGGAAVAQVDDEKRVQDQDHQEMKRTDIDCDETNGLDGEKKNTGFRVKIVLTREELEWFLLQLQENNSNDNKGVGNKKKKLEAVLEEMQRSSSPSRTGRLWKADDEDGRGWKPSLDSIMESPEVPDQMDRC